MTTDVAEADPPTPLVTHKRRFHTALLQASAVPAVAAPAWTPDRWPTTLLTPAEIDALVVSRLATADAGNRHWVRRNGVRRVLAWLQSFPGDSWQDRWRCVEERHRGRGWLHAVTDDPDPAENLRSLAVTGIGTLVALDVVRPSYAWLADNTFATTWKHMHRLRNASAYVQVQAMQAAVSGRPREAEDALLVLARIQAHTGKDLGQVSGQDILDYRCAIRMLGRNHKGLALCWEWMRQLGCLHHPAHDLPSSRQHGRLSVDELVDQYGVHNREVRDVLVRYLREREPFLDYVSLKGLALRLVKHFWCDIEKHHPEVATLHLPHDVVTTWKQRFRLLPDGSPRASPQATFFAVRSLYVDISQWALHDPATRQRHVAPHPCTPPTPPTKPSTKRDRNHEPSSAPGCSPRCCRSW